MRLDKYLSEAAICSRSEASKAAKAGKITVNGVAQKSTSVHINPECDVVYYCGEKVKWSLFTYVMLNKPQGFVSSTEDKGRTVMELLPEECTKKKMFPCGRLDIDTTGLLLITNDGDMAHRLLSPKHHVSKTYAYTCSEAIDGEKKNLLENGVDIGGHISLPSKVECETPVKGKITITEGKFHQIKRMFEAVNSKILTLERVSFASLSLDTSLQRGEWRYLTEEEIASLNNDADRQ